MHSRQDARAAASVRRVLARVDLQSTALAELDTRAAGNSDKLRVQLLPDGGPPHGRGSRGLRSWRRTPGGCSHRRTTWRSTRWLRGAGRCRRSPGTPAVTARRSRSTWPAAAGGAASGRRVAWSRSASTSRRGSPTTRTWTRRCCIASSSTRGSIGRTRRWCASCAGWSCGRCAWSASTGAATAPTVEIEHPAGRGDPVGLARAARDAVGRAGVRAGRRAVALGPVPRRVLRADDVRAPRRGDAPGARRAGRHAAGVADRPDGDDRDPGHRPAHRRRRARLAKHYGVEIAVCPPRRAQRKGVVEKAIQYLTRSWWRTAAGRDAGRGAAPLDRWCVEVADRRRAAGGHGRRARRRRAAAGAAGGGLPGGDRGRAQGRRARRWSRSRATATASPPGLVGRTRHGPRPRRRAAPARSSPPPGELVADAPPRAGRRRADDPQRRARRRCSSRRSWPRSRPTSLPAQGQPAARPRRARRARAAAAACAAEPAPVDRPRAATPRSRRSPC